MNFIKKSGLSMFATALAAALFASSSNVLADPINGELGTYIYSEPSDETRAEILDLLNFQQKKSEVFLIGLSMGLPINEILQASVRNDLDNGQEYLNAASEMLQLVGFSRSEEFAGYSVGDLSNPSSATEVINRFFENDKRLSGSPDWQVGESHMMVAASELKALAQQYNDGNYWYVTDDATDAPSATRPIFIQLYSEHNYAIVNDVQRINRSAINNPDAQLPVVFVFNGSRERPISQMTQPATVQNIVNDYKQYNLIATAPPEWSLGEYHAMVPVSELDSYFGLPSEQSLSPERWSELLNEIQSSGIKDSFVVSILSNGGSNNDSGSAILNRADKVAAAKALGYSEVPISYYYVDQRRVSPYTQGMRGLGYAAVQAGMASNISPAPVGIVPIVGGNGGVNNPTPPPPPPVVVIPEPPTKPIVECASPPCPKP